MASVPFLFTQHTQGHRQTLLAILLFRFKTQQMCISAAVHISRIYLNPRGVTQEFVNLKKQTRVDAFSPLSLSFFLKKKQKKQNTKSDH